MTARDRIPYQCSGWVVGLDLSLTATGLATTHTPDAAPKLATGTLTLRSRGHERLSRILAEVQDVVGLGTGSSVKADLVVIEGASYASQGSARWQLAELHGLVKHELWRCGIPYVLVAPQARAKYATGKGGAGKDEVLLAVDRRYGQWVTVGDNNSADALVLLAMAVDHYGAPIAIIPQTHRAALDKVDWPSLPGVSR